MAVLLTWHRVSSTDVISYHTYLIGTQTIRLADECDQPFKRQLVPPLKLSPIKRNSLEEVKEVNVATETATFGASTSDVQTSVSLSTETQTRNRDLEPNGMLIFLGGCGGEGVGVRAD